MNLSEVLEDLYDSELNFELSTFWDAGYTIKLGDTQNGFSGKSEMLNSLKEVTTELIRLVIDNCPRSDFAKKYSTSTS